jgi:hypothetical protein
MKTSGLFEILLKSERLDHKIPKAGPRDLIIKKLKV